MTKTRDVGNIGPDLDRYLDQAFNKLIRTTMRRLATKKRSPVDTGFFASSWQASTSPVDPKDEISEFAPWSELKAARTAAFFAGLNKPNDYVIEPRFYPPERQYSYKQRVYIGNSAKYALYALEDGRVQRFIQGPEMAKLVKDAFNERKARISVAGSQNVGAISGQTYIGYSEV